MARRESVQGSLRGDAEGRLSLPFLPTLVTALVIGAASMLCREPARTPAQAPAAAEIGPQAFAPAAAALPAPRAPAAVIFAAHYPLAVGAAPRPAPRLATAASRRQLMRSAERMPEAAPRRPESLAGKAAPDPLAPARSEIEEAESLLPDLALPYADPAARAVGEAARYLRERAAAVTGTVGGTVRGSVSVLADAVRAEMR